MVHHILEPWPAAIRHGLKLSVFRYWVTVFSIVFLAIPLCIFLTGWLRFSISWPVTVLTVFGVVAFIRETRNRFISDMNGFADETRISTFRMLVAVSIVCIPAVLCGAGGFGSQSWDWAKHNAILRDLIIQPWPVIYQTEKDAVALVYYIAYYLPAALVGKVLGWNIANLTLFVTTLVGVILSFCWLTIFSRGAAILAALVLVLFSGMDFLGAMIINPPSAWPGFLDALYLDSWGQFWQYSSNISILYFVPQQALGAWLATALLVDGLLRSNYRLPLAFLVAVLALWSPFAVIGVLPFVVYYLIRMHTRSALKQQINLTNIAGAVLCLLLLLFYISRFNPYHLPDAYPMPTSGRLAGAFDFVLMRTAPDVFVKRYLLFVLIEFFLLASLVVFVLKSYENPVARTVILISIFSLLLLPIFYYGIYNDLVMRASIPGLFVIQIGVVLAMGCRGAVFGRIAICCFLAIGSIYTINLLRIYIENSVGARQIVRTPKLENVPTLLHIRMATEVQLAFTSQYLGSTQSVYFQWLSPDVQPYPVGLPKNRE